jgi:hypothetical protein
MRNSLAVNAISTPLRRTIRARRSISQSPNRQTEGVTPAPTRVIGSGPPK